MILKMYAIKDELNGYTTPIPFMNEELVKRYLKDQYMSNPTIGNSPKDFSIWCVGEYDNDTGEMKPYKDIKLIERCENYV